MNQTFAATFISLAISMFAYSQGPTADFSATPLEICLGESIDFTDLSTAGAVPIVGWSWDFGDGNSSLSQNPTHTYTLAGTYTITLVVTDQNALADPEVKVNYIVVNPLPNVGFQTAGNGCTVPFDVTFTNTSDMGAQYTYAWDFGNTQTSTQANPPLQTYSVPGTYTVSLTVTNTVTGCVDTYSEDFNISDFSAGISGPQTACVMSPADFLDMSTISADTWLWDFGDGNTSTQQNPSNTYVAPGTYTVSLFSENSVSGCSDTTSTTITVLDLPTPSFFADDSLGCAPLDVNFTNTTVEPGTFEWNFGNGNTFSGETPPTETYNSNGQYSVTLIMTDTNGCIGLFTSTNMITVADATADFDVTPIEGCEPLTVTFTDLSAPVDPANDPIVTWEWDFGDGSPVFNGQTPPPHDYAVGVYSPTLTITTQDGCTDTQTYVDTIQVGTIQDIGFFADTLIQCAKAGVTFTDTTDLSGVSNLNEVTWNWDFGDGATSTQQNPMHPYPTDTGYFDVTLVVGWRGCYDTLVKTDYIYINAPISLFTPDQTLFCNPTALPVTLNVEDIAIHGVIPDDLEMVWSWGDGDTTFFDDPDLDDADQGSTTHDYTAYGTYEIEQLIINHTTGCQDSTTQTINVSTTTADFLLSNDSTCINDAITLTSTSTSSHPFGTYNYDMGDGGSASGDPATYTYTVPGTYNVTLVANNSVGCADTTTFVGMEALSLPQAIITPSATAGCAPITVTYNNASTPTGNGVPLETFDWTYPDLTTETTLDTSITTSYTFNTEGNFTTNMLVTDEFGCQAQTLVSMSITKPTADFSIDTIFCNNENFTATNSSVSGVSYQWYLDGNLVSTDPDYTDTFNETDSPSFDHIDHNIMLITTDVNGCTDTLDQDVIVSMPTAIIDYELTGANVNAQGDYTCPPVFATFADSSVSYGAVTDWNWNFGDGKFSTLQDPSNTYVFAGTYTVSLAITNEYGCTSDTALIDYLTIFGPEAQPSMVQLDVCGQEFDFAIDSLNGVSTIVWDFGDGNVYNDSTEFTYYYDTTGAFLPTVTLADELGCEVVYELNNVNIQEHGMDAFYVPSPSEGAIGTLFTFDDQSTTSGNPIQEWEWSYEGNVVTNFNDNDLIEVYNLPGTHVITLTISNAQGCTDIYIDSIFVTEEFDLPNVLTVNNDNVNDIFELPSALFESFHIVILNRWGNVVHEMDNATGKFLWDGMHMNGSQVNDGVYFYRIRGTTVTGKDLDLNGHITILSGQ